MSRDDDAKVGRLVMQAEPEITWIATDDNGKSAMCTSDRCWPRDTKKYVEDWVRDHPVVNGNPVKLMHWEKWPRYTDCPAADYSVLVRVRETWHVEHLKRMRMELFSIVAKRDDINDSEWWDVILNYRPGDWSRAALKVMAETSG